MKNLLAGICLVLLLLGNGWAGDEKKVAVEVLSKTGSSWNGKALLKYPAGIPEITILKISIPAGVELPMHTHPVINAGVLLSGQLTVVTEDNRILHLNAGDAIVEVVDTWHYGKNEGSTPAEIIVFYAGVPGQPITVKR